MEKDNATYYAKDIMRNREISIQARTLYIAICSFCDIDRRECEPAISDLINASGMSKNTFYKYMHELEQKGIVKKYYVRTGPRPLDRKLHYQLCE